MAAEQVTQVTVIPPKPPMVVVEDGPMAYLMDTARFEHLYRIAKVMAGSSLVPEHLCKSGTKGNVVDLPPDVVVANCFRVCNQAMRWGMDPFSVIDETYVARGKLGFQGKLIAGVINTRAGLRGRLTVEYDGQGDNRAATISGQFKDEAVARKIKVVLKDVRTDNTMWTKDPDQKLWYTGATKWGRRHAPEIMLGIITDDDLERLKESQPAIEAPGTLTLAESLAQSAVAEKTMTLQETTTEPRTPTVESDGGVNPDMLAQDYLDQIAGLKTKDEFAGVLQQLAEDEMILGADRIAALRKAVESAQAALTPATKKK